MQKLVKFCKISPFPVELCLNIYWLNEDGSGSNLSKKYLSDKVIYRAIFLNILFWGSTLLPKFGMCHTVPQRVHRSGCLNVIMIHILNDLRCSDVVLGNNALLGKICLSTSYQCVCIHGISLSLVKCRLIDRLWIFFFFFFDSVNISTNSCTGIT